MIDQSSVTPQALVVVTDVNLMAQETRRKRRSNSTNQNYHLWNDQDIKRQLCGMMGM